MWALLTGAGEGIAKTLGHITPAMWKWIGVAVAAMLLFWLGYSMGGRHVRERIESARVEALEEALTSERDRAVREAALATELAAKLRKSEDERENNVRTIIREIPVYVTDNPQCDLPQDLMQRLNEVTR